MARQEPRGQPSQHRGNELVRTPCFASSGSLVREPEKKKKVYAQMTGQVQDLNLNASSLFVPGADGERMYYRSALFPPSPQIADTPKSVSGVSERH